MSKINKFQKIGIILILIGIVLLLFPYLIGDITIRIVGSLFIGVGIYLIIKNKQIIGIGFLGTILLFIGLTLFTMPQIVLYFSGYTLLIVGAFKMLRLTKLRNKQWKKYVIPVIFIGFGLFCIFNADAAMTTIILLLGILTTALGIMILIKQQKFFTSADDDIIDVDFYEK